MSLSSWIKEGGSASLNSGIRDLSWRGLWTTGFQYYRGNVVQFGGITYVATHKSVSAEPDISPTMWDVFAEGIGHSFNYRGYWVSGTAYYAEDAVTYNGALYIAIGTVTNLTQFPNLSSVWNLAIDNGAGINWRGSFVPGTSYQIADAVSYQGSSYICVVAVTENSTPVADSAKWNLFASAGTVGATGVQGAPGAPGTSINWRGPFVPGTSYQIADAVSYQGSSYICIVAVTENSTPVADSAKWNLLSSEGAIGIQGATGLTGGTGATGPSANLAIHQIPSWNNSSDILMTATCYIEVLMNSTSSTVTATMAPGTYTNNSVLKSNGFSSCAINTTTGLITVNFSTPFTKGWIPSLTPIFLSGSGAISNFTYQVDYSFSTNGPSLTTVYLSPFRYDGSAFSAANANAILMLALTCTGV